jgi:C4-dicarboxylate-specific signal transduction histidine kinase
MLCVPPHASLAYSNLLERVHADDRPIASGIIASPKNALNMADIRIVRPTGQIRWISVRTTPQFSEGGHAGASGVFVDITDRKEAEAEADRQRRELAHLMRVTQVSELSGGLAHEITQPLTSILANAQAAQSMLASAHPDVTELNEILEDIVQEDHRAGEVINRLRGLLRNDQDSVEPVDLNDLVASTLHLLRSELVARHVKADVALTQDTVLVSGDAVQLQQVLLNLVMNSIDAVNRMPTARRVVTVGTRRTASGDVEASVRDRGIGIDSVNLQRMFEPFFTTKERGLGLGLSICSTIIKRHGGTLSIENNRDGGATAQFRLPARAKGTQHAH